jgi:hypothetical protein
MIPDRVIPPNAAVDPQNAQAVHDEVRRVRRIPPRKVDGDAVTYRRACECASTGSGPRPIIMQRETADGLEVGFTMAAVACDECGTPWTRVAA